MFTLKLYRRAPNISTKEMHVPNHKTTMILGVDDVVVHEIGLKGQALELRVRGPKMQAPWGDTYYVGVPEEGMDAHGRDDLHLDMGPGGWWGWGLLENEAGKTTEHYRPHNYG